MGKRRLGGEVGKRRLGGEVGKRRLGGEVGKRRLGGEVGRRRLGGEVGRRRLGGEVGKRRLRAWKKNVPSMQPFPITILYLIWLVTAHIAQGMLGTIMTWEGISPKIPA